MDPRGWVGWGKRTVEWVWRESGSCRRRFKGRIKMKVIRSDLISDIERKTTSTKLLIMQQVSVRSAPSKGCFHTNSVLSMHIHSYYSKPTDETKLFPCTLWAEIESIYIDLSSRGLNLFFSPACGHEYKEKAMFFLYARWSNRPYMPYAHLMFSRENVRNMNTWGPLTQFVVWKECFLPVGLSPSD